MRRLPPEIADAPFHRRLVLGTISRAQLEGPRFTRMSRGVYLTAGSLDGASPEAIIATRIAACRQALPKSAVLSDLTAAWAHGAPLALPTYPVEVICPHRVRARPGLIVRFDQLDPSEIVWTTHGPATSPARTAFDLARRARLPRPAADELFERMETRLIDLHGSDLGPFPRFPDALGFPDLGVLAGQRVETVTARLATAVAYADAVLYATKTPVAELARVVSDHHGARWVTSARVVARLADNRAQSPPESRMRVRVALSTLPMGEPQVPLRDSRGLVIAYTDLGFHAFRLGAEYDGIYHRERRQASRDLGRDGAAHRARWSFVHFDVIGLRDPLQYLRTLHAALADRPVFRRPPSARV